MWLSWLAWAWAFALCCLCSQATAQQVPQPDAPSPLKARVALSRDADLRLFSVRVRRLLAIELYGVVEVEERANGPLDAELIRVWIDVPTPERSLIEVRRSGRSLARRALDISNLPSDVAARIVAIESAEMVRVQASAAARPKSTAPTTSEQDELAASPYAIEASAASRWLPLGEGALMAGPELSVEHRHSTVGQRLYARWLLGHAGALGPMRWIEAGAGADLRVRVEDALRLRFGATAGLVAVTLPDAVQINGDHGSTDWSGALGLLAGVEGRSGQALLGASATGGVLLRGVEVQTRSGDRNDLGIMSIGLRLSIAAAPPARKPLQHDPPEASAP